MPSTSSASAADSVAVAAVGRAARRSMSPSTARRSPWRIRAASASRSPRVRTRSAPHSWTGNAPRASTTSSRIFASIRCSRRPVAWELLRSPDPSTQPAQATLPVAAASSSAIRPLPTKSVRARGRSSPRSRAGRIAARSLTTKSKRFSVSISRAGATATSKPASSRRSRASSWRPASCIALKRSPKAFDRARHTASAISSWRPACRFSCGAAFPTTSCWMSQPRGGCATRPCSASR